MMDNIQQIQKEKDVAFRKCANDLVDKLSKLSSTFLLLLESENTGEEEGVIAAHEEIVRIFRQFNPKIKEMRILHNEALKEAFLAGSKFGVEDFRSRIEPVMVKLLTEVKEKNIKEKMPWEQPGWEEKVAQAVFEGDQELAEKINALPPNDPKMMQALIDI